MNKKNKKSIIQITNLIIYISIFTVVAFGMAVLTQGYIDSDLPHGIFNIFWIIGIIAILCKMCITDFRFFREEKK